MDIAVEVSPVTSLGVKFCTVSMRLDASTATVDPQTRRYSLHYIIFEGLDHVARNSILEYSSSCIHKIRNHEFVNLYS